jgi:signal transduction histidine kinase
VALNLEFGLDVPDQLIADSQRIKQIFLNLLSNANKFTFKGSINASLDYDPLTKSLSGRVTDTGIGIKDED